MPKRPRRLVEHSGDVRKRARIDGLDHVAYVSAYLP
jgi:hypothetical protein